MRAKLRFAGEGCRRAGRHGTRPEPPPPRDDGRRARLEPLSPQNGRRRADPKPPSLPAGRTLARQALRPAHTPAVCTTRSLLAPSAPAVAWPHTRRADPNFSPGFGGKTNRAQYGRSDAPSAEGLLAAQLGKRRIHIRWGDHATEAAQPAPRRQELFSPHPVYFAMVMHHGCAAFARRRTAENAVT